MLSRIDRNAPFLLPSSRHAAPMQKRVLPASLARCAAATISSRFIIGVGLSPVLWRVDCEQYEQSSVQPPVLIESSVHCCTSRGSHTERCTVAAW
jgi:hypothetical protein